MSPKEIRSKINNIQNTQKITYAMEMVATSKMRKAKEKMLASAPYARHVLRVVARIASGNIKYSHAYLEKKTKVQRVGFIIVSSDRGLCGGLNMNLFRLLLEKIQAFQSQGVEVEICTLGHKAELFCKKIQAMIVASKSYLGGSPNMSDMVGPVSVILEGYETARLDSVYLFYNQFINSMTLTPKCIDLLPIIPSVDSIMSGDYLYEPDSREVLDVLFVRFIEAQVYQAVVENFACEQAARMIAMKNATENAIEIKDQLKMDYNKARQAAITRELSEIVAGAAAV